MPRTVTLILSPKQAADKDVYIPVAAKRAGVSPDSIALARITKRSIDSRGQGIKVNLTLELFIDGEQQPAPVHFDYPDVSVRPEVVIVGGGPAGLFAALRLIELNYRPIILERGKDVSRRKRDIAEINRNGDVNPDSNYAFGEGGAGTFSDGKLFTRSKKRGDYNKALRTLVFHGASPEILYDAHPHIGTDRLPAIMTAIRKTITDCGGRVVFDSKVDGLILEKGQAKGVTCNGTKIEGAAVVLATGHSAKDIYEMLHRQEVLLQAKPFAMGVRVEHPQELIDRIQYHGAGREYLPAASYTLTAQVGGAGSRDVRGGYGRQSGYGQRNGRNGQGGYTGHGRRNGHGAHTVCGPRGVYSFCMCPGGFIVPAMTDRSESVVNGMSPSSRGSLWANSGIVTEIRLEDFAHLEAEHGPLAGLIFQQQFEQAARANGGSNQIAPAQRLTDFVVGRASADLPATSYVPGITPSRLDVWMPDFIASSLREGLRSFENRMRGFLTPEAMIVGVESRTSTPVRIPRDPETLAHPQIEGLYPAGEGAGYAGGIISAALDGERVAEAIVSAVHNAK